MKTDNKHNDRKSIPIDSIREAELLLEYIAQQGLDIAPKFISDIVKAKHISYSANEWTPEIEADFWQAFNAAAKAIAPVTITSIKATYDSPRSGFPFTILRSLFKKQFKNSIANKHFMRFMRFTLFVLLFLLIVQIYFSFGANTIKNVDQFNEKLIVMQAQLASKSQEKRLEDTESNKLLIQIDDTVNRLNVSLSFLEKWSMFLLNRLRIDLDIFPQQKGLKSPQEKLKQEASKNLKITEASKLLLLQPIQLYILPLLYGLMGACVFVLRTLSEKIKAVTYTPVSNVGYWLRIQLGALAGLALGWFVSPEKISAFSSLPPFALAFMAGYSVDLLFSALNTFVSAFSGKSPQDSQGRQSPEKKS